MYTDPAGELFRLPFAGVAAGCTSLHSLQISHPHGSRTIAGTASQSRSVGRTKNLGEKDKGRESIRADSTAR